MNYQKGRFLKVCQGPGQRSLLEQDVAREQGGEVREPFTFDSAGIHTLWQIFLGPRGPLRVPLSVRPFVRPSVRKKNLNHL